MFAALRVKDAAYAEVPATNRPFDFIAPLHALEETLAAQIGAVRRAVASLGSAAEKRRRVV